MARKLVRLNIQETSGVDHPAHLTEGWVVMKSAESSEVTAVLDELRPTDSPVEAITPVSKEETMSETPEVVIIPEEATDADILKAMPAAIRKMLTEATANAEAALSESAALQAELRKERDARADEAAVVKASAWSHLSIDPSIVGPALRRLSETDEVLASEIVKALDAANAQVETNAVFTEIGSDSTVSVNDAYSKMESLAKSAVADGVAPSFESALMSVAQSNPDLYTQYLNEKGR